jgi:SAM-dependent methyltransferase
MIAEPRYSEYDPFARMYNESWGLQFCEKTFPILEKLLLKKIPPNSQILDLCCGTGQISKQLLEKGYQLTGLDGSESMLHYARQNAPKAEFILGDARYFNFEPSFNAVISTTAALNHILNLNDLQNIFNNVHASLLKDGWFFFDLYLDGVYHLQNWQGSVSEGMVKDDYAWAYRGQYYTEKKVGKYTITLFELIERKWRRSDITYLLQSYTRAEITIALEQAGFTEIIVYDRQGNPADSEYNLITFFMARKP